MTERLPSNNYADIFSSSFSIICLPSHSHGPALLWTRYFGSEWQRLVARGVCPLSYAFKKWLPFPLSEKVTHLGNFHIYNGKSMLTDNLSKITLFVKLQGPQRTYNEFIFLWNPKPRTFSWKYDIWYMDPHTCSRNQVKMLP
jgi:hypothetical protein